MLNSQHPKIRLETKTPRLIQISYNKSIYKQLYKTHPNIQLILKINTSHLDSYFLRYLQLLKNN